MIERAVVIYTVADVIIERFKKEKDLKGNIKKGIQHISGRETNVICKKKKCI